MSHINETDVKRICGLARIHAPDNPERLKALAGDINAILDFVEQLQEVDTAGVEPLASAAGLTLTPRKDAITDGGIQDQVLKNAPESTEGFYVTQKIIGEAA